MINENVRIYGRVKTLSIEDLQQAFAAVAYVKLALLFGSRAAADTSAGHPQSDYDFAVLMDKSRPCDWGHLARLRTDIGNLLSLPDTDFDVVDLEIASKSLLDSVKIQYKILKGDIDDVRCVFGKHCKDC